MRAACLSRMPSSIAAPVSVPESLMISTASAVCRLDSAVSARGSPNWCGGLVTWVAATRDAADDGAAPRTASRTAMTAGASGRSAGSLRSIWSTISASLPHLAGSGGSSFKIAAMVASMLPSPRRRNGERRSSAQNSVTPNDQRSAGGPTRRPRSRSGAMNSVVPRTRL